MISIIQLLIPTEAAVTRTHVPERELLPLRFTAHRKAVARLHLRPATQVHPEVIPIQLRQEANTAHHPEVIVRRLQLRQEATVLRPLQVEVADRLLPEVVRADRDNVLQLPDVNRVIAELPFKRSYFEG